MHIFIVHDQVCGDNASRVGASLRSWRIELELEEGHSGYARLVGREPDRVVLDFGFTHRRILLNDHARAGAAVALRLVGAASVVRVDVKWVGVVEVRLRIIFEMTVHGALGVQHHEIQV